MNAFEIRQMKLTQVQIDIMNRSNVSYERLAELYNIIKNNRHIFMYNEKLEDVVKYFNHCMTSKEALCIVQLYGVLTNKHLELCN